MIVLNFLSLPCSVKSSEPTSISLVGYHSEIRVTSSLPRKFRTYFYFSSWASFLISRYLTQRSLNVTYRPSYLNFILNCIHVLYPFHHFSRQPRLFLVALGFVKLCCITNVVRGHGGWTACALVKKRKTSERVKLLIWKHILDCECVFTLKHNEDGSVIQYNHKINSSRFCRILQC